METMTKTKITVQALVNAPVKKVWEAWTTPAAIMQWNFASDDWYCPGAANDLRVGAANDLRVGGKFTSRMEAKDGSFGFDFEGIYDEVVDLKKITYRMPDGRQATTTFTGKGEKTEVTTIFDAETENSVELQQGGWQAILNNFKAYAERMVNMETLYFEIEIEAPASKVADIMLGEKTFTEWTAEFNPTSTFRGSWQKGSKVLFIGVDDKGNEGGMVSRIKEHLPNKHVSIQHLGVLDKGKEVTEGPAVAGWAGALENYYFLETKGGTKLSVTLDSNAEFKEYFSESWLRALKKLKQICEA